MLLTKHTDLGYHMYDILAKTAFASFAESFIYEESVAVLGIDDHVRYGYSHTALLARRLKSRVLVPYYGKLRDVSGHHYSGKDFQYRLTHPRAFEFGNVPQEKVILVDDILTTGLTLTQAAEVVQEKRKEVLFCLTLADAKR